MNSIHFNPLVIIVTTMAILCSPFIADQVFSGQEPGSAPIRSSALTVSYHDGALTVVATNVPLKDLLAELARVPKIRIFVHPSVANEQVSMRLEGVQLENAVTQILKGKGYIITYSNDPKAKSPSQHPTIATVTVFQAAKSSPSFPDHKGRFSEAMASRESPIKVLPQARIQKGHFDKTAFMKPEEAPSSPPGPTVADLLKDSTAGGNTEARIDALSQLAELLSEMPPSEQQQVAINLASLLRDQSPEIRSEAVHLLEGSDLNPAILPLVDLLTQNLDQNLQAETFNLLRTTDQPASIDILGRAILQAADPAVKLEAMNILLEKTAFEDLPAGSAAYVRAVLGKATLDSNPEVQTEAKQLLEEFQSYMPAAVESKK